MRTVSSAVTINDSSFICRDSFNDTRTLAASVKSPNDGDTPVPIIYFVTPTYPRREQIAEITRLGQTLMHVPNLHWIVADDTDTCNAYLDIMLSRFGEYSFFFFIDMSMKSNIDEKSMSMSMSIPCL